MGELVQALVKRLVLVDDGDVADLVDLVQPLEAVLNQLSQVDGRLDSVGDALDDDGVLLVLAVEELPCALEVSADAHGSPDPDLVLRKSLLVFLDLSVSFRHLKIKL